MSEISELLLDYEKKYSAFVAICQKISPEDQLRGGVCGYWSPKQVINHFSAWAEVTLTIFEKTLAGETPNLEYDDDVFNEKAVTEREHQGWEDSMAEMDLNKQKIVHFITQLNPDQFSKSELYTHWVKGIGEDYDLHRQQLTKWVKPD